MPLSQVSSQKGESFDDVTLQAVMKSLQKREPARPPRPPGHAPSLSAKIEYEFQCSWSEDNLRRTCALLRFPPSAKMPKKHQLILTDKLRYLHTANTWTTQAKCKMTSTTTGNR
jgi:hypothetical protein